MNFGWEILNLNQLLEWILSSLLKIMRTAFTTNMEFNLPNQNKLVSNENLKLAGASLNNSNKMEEIVSTS